MNKKRHQSLNPIQHQDEVVVFLDQVLQWLCNLQSQEVALFEEKRVFELGQALAKKLDVAVFCDLDRNYCNAHNLKILINGKGKVLPMSKKPDYYEALQASQFEVRVDISRKGGFFCLRSYSVSQIENTGSLAPAKENSKQLLKICDQISRFLTEKELIQVPEALLDRHMNGRNELGGEVTVMTQLFGEI